MREVYQALGFILTGFLGACDAVEGGHPFDNLGLTYGYEQTLVTERRRYFVRREDEDKSGEE